MYTPNMYGRVLDAMMCMTRQCWEDGMVAQALMETGEYTKLDIVVYDMVLRQSADGRLCNVENTPAVTDSSFCIPAVYLTGKQKNNQELINAALKNIKFLLYDAERAEEGTLYHMRGTTDIWADSMAFLPYSLALTGHKKEGIAQMRGVFERLYDSDKGLCLHMWDECKQRFIRPLAWGVGNGWALTGLLRMLPLYADEGESYDWLMATFFKLLDTMLSHMTAEGCFHDVLDDPDTFCESETAAMIAYTVYKAALEKILPENKIEFYLKKADLIHSSLWEKVDERGIVMNAASSPSFNHPGSSVECQAHFLMMEKEKTGIMKLRNV